MPSPAFATLTPVQAQVVFALAQGATVTAAAAAAGINRCTIPEWRRTHPQFDQALQEARGQYRLALHESLGQIGPIAASTLRTMLEDPQTRPAVRRKLALRIFSQLKTPLPDAPTGAKIGRNEPCPCGSGKKFKRCCLLTPAPPAAL